MLEVLRSGRLSLGPMQERFERAFADRLGVPDAVAVSSGTAALHLGVRALGWGTGDEVVTSPFSFVASANCLLYEGATPVFCDVDPVTLNLDPGRRPAAIGERTAGLLPVDILGYPAAMPALERLAADRGLGLLEDACEALGRRRRRRAAVGSRGNLADLRLLRQQAADDGRGRDARRRRPRGRGAAAQRAQPGPGAGHGLGRPRPARLQLPPHRAPGGARRRPARAPRRAARRPRACRGHLHRAPRGARLRGARRRGRPRRARAAVRRPWRGAAQLVRLRRPAAGGGRPRRGARRPRPARGRGQGLHAVHPPDGASTASGSAIARASSRSPRTPRRGCWRCRSSPRSPSAQIDRVCEALAEALRGDWT